MAIQLRDKAKDELSFQIFYLIIALHKP